MLDVELPRISAMRAGPWRLRAAATASMKPSACRPSHASRLLRQSQLASESGSRSASMPSTRPIQVGSGVGPKSLARRPLRDCSSAERRAVLPTPTDEVAVKALICKGGMREGDTVEAGWINDGSVQNITAYQ